MSETNVTTAKGWRWMAGMLLASGQRIDGAEEGRPVRYSQRPAEWSPVGELVRVEEYSMPPYEPDRNDAPTRGALLELVREAHGDPYAWVQPYCLDGVDGFAVFRFRRLGLRLSFALAEWDALVAALLAAP